MFSFLVCIVSNKKFPIISFCSFTGNASFLFHLFLGFLFIRALTAFKQFDYEVSWLVSLDLWNSLGLWVFVVVVVVAVVLLL